MNFKEYKEIKNRRYTPKEILAILILNSKNVVGKDIEEMQNLLGQAFIQNVDRQSRILEKVDINLLKKITNYWGLTLEQGFSYGYIVFDTIRFENRNFSAKEITEMFIDVMRIYSPNNAEKLVRRKLNMKNV